MLANPSLARPLFATEVSRHKCVIYSGHPSEQLPVVTPFLREGLRERWRCLYLGNPEMLQMVDTALSAHGVDTGYEQRCGALVLSAQRDHLQDGVFNAQKMADSISAYIDDALRDGYGGLYATGDMRWELGSEENFPFLLRYEAIIEQILRERPMHGMCQYHRDILPASAVHDALLSHRYLYLDNVLERDNLFYMPPELLLDNEKNVADRAEWMCQQILRIQRSERLRDNTVATLRKSEADQRARAAALANMNHDLESRVANLTTELELTKEHLDAFAYTVSRHLTAANISHMDDLIEGMLSLSKAGQMEMRTIFINITAVAHEIAAELRKTAPDRRALFTIQNGMMANGDLTLVRAALTHLMNNAWKFTSKKPDARIEVGQLPDKAFLVHDNGVGFDMVRAKNLFSLFQRFHNPEDFPGTGIGLATVERIISRHGGKVWAESKPGVGATFYFTLPGHKSKAPTAPDFGPCLQ